MTSTSATGGFVDGRSRADEANPTGAPTGSATAGALDGLLVADFSRVLAGPFATQQMADLGADVIKVESPSGDETRHWLPPARDGVSTYYLSINRSKRDIVLDFADPADRALAQELARRADVVVENFRPGGLAKFGLDYESVAASNPRVVYASISGFGSAGGARLPGYDLLVQAASGLMSMTGDAEGQPYRSGVSVFDVMTGMQALVGILAALRHRSTTGLGQHVEVNLLSTALAAMANHTSAYLGVGEVPHRMGNAHPSLYPYQPLPTASGELVVVAANDSQFAKLARALGRPELLDDQRFGSPEARNRNRADLHELLVEALSHRSAQEWFTVLSAADVPCGPINTIEQGIHLAESLGLDPVVHVGEPGYQVPMIRNPIGLSRTPAMYFSSPPTLGAHDNELRTWLSTEATEAPL